MSFSIGRAISQSFEILSAKFGPMLGVTLIATALSWAVLGSYMGSMAGSMLLNPTAGEAEMMRGMGAGLILVYLLNFAIGVTGDAATCALCSDRQAHTIGSALSAAVRALPTLAGTLLLFVVAMIGVTLVLGMVIGIMSMSSRNPAMILIVTLLMMVGFAYLGTKLSLILPVIAIDEVRNPFNAVGRSWQLSSGNTFKVFAFYFIVMMVIGIIMVTVMLATIGVPVPGSMPQLGAIRGLMIGLMIFAMLIKLFFIAMVSAVHRQLSGPSDHMVHETFA